MLDGLEDDDPVIAAEVVAAAVEVTDAVSRLGRMVEAGKLHPGYVQHLHRGRILHSVSSSQFATLLKQLAPADSTVDRLKYAVELVGDRWQGDPEMVLREDEESVATIRDILARSATADDNVAFWWERTMQQLASRDPEWVVAAATLAVSGEDFTKQRRASGILSELAATHPDAVMAVVGGELLSEERGWRWRIGSKRELISAIPVDVVMQWLSRVGTEGARRIARHLSSPVVTSEGVAVVPEITECVLSEYGDDKTVFDEFAIGRHDLEMMRGPLSSNYESHAHVARAFLNHRLLVIRRWAEYELASAEHSVDIWRKREEDEEFEG